MISKKASDYFQLSTFESTLVSIIKSAYKALQLKEERIFIIGGFVRDKILGNSIRDYDFICNHNDHRKLALYLSTNASAFGIQNCHTHKLSAKTCKDDWLFKFTLKGKEIEIKSYSCKLSEDTIKRDFTINAVYYDIFSQNLLDYCGGISDIHNKIIKTVCSCEKTFGDSFERFIRLARFSIKGLTIDHNVVDYIRVFFDTKKYEGLKINWKSVALQLDRIFESKNTCYIFDNLRTLSILNCLHKEFKHYSNTNTIYKETVRLLQKLEIVLYNPVFMDFITKNLEEKTDYKKLCKELKKAAVAYIFTRRKNFVDFQSIEDLEFKFNIEHKHDPCLQKLLKSFDYGNETYFPYYFDKYSKYPFLGLILLIKNWPTKDLRGQSSIEKIINNENFLKHYKLNDKQVESFQDAHSFISNAQDLQHLLNRLKIDNA